MVIFQKFTLKNLAIWHPLVSAVTDKRQEVATRGSLAHRGRPGPLCAFSSAEWPRQAQGLTRLPNEKALSVRTQRGPPGYGRRVGSAGAGREDPAQGTPHPCSLLSAGLPCVHGRRPAESGLSG